MNNQKQLPIFEAIQFGFKNIFTYFRPLFYLNLIMALFWVLIPGISFGIIKLYFNPMNFREIPWKVLSPAALIIFFFMLATSSLFFNFAIKIAEGSAGQRVELPSFSKILKSATILFLSLVVGVVGLFLFVIPGIWWFVRSYFALYAVLADDLGVIASFKRSFAMSCNYGWSIFALLIFNGVMLSINPLFLSLLPIMNIANAYLYFALRDNK